MIQIRQLRLLYNHYCHKLVLRFYLSPSYTCTEKVGVPVFYKHQHHFSLNNLLKSNKRLTSSGIFIYHMAVPVYFAKYPDDYPYKYKFKIRIGVA